MVQATRPTRRHQDRLPLRDILTPGGLTDILENYAQLVEEKDERTGKKRRKQIFPRYHQLDAVHKLLSDVASRGAASVTLFSILQAAARATP